MIMRPPRSTRPDTPFPYPTLFRSLAFIGNTGHEYEYLGAAEAMKQIAPPPAATRFWLHIGANVAARDWHDIAGHLTPLPSVDSQRFLSISPALLPLARAIRSEEHTSELQSLMRLSYAVFCLKKKTQKQHTYNKLPKHKSKKQDRCNTTPNHT